MVLFIPTLLLFAAANEDVEASRSDEISPCKFSPSPTTCENPTEKGSRFRCIGKRAKLELWNQIDYLGQTDGAASDLVSRLTFEVFFSISPGLPKVIARNGDLISETFFH